MSFVKSILESAMKKWKSIYLTYKIIFIICILSFSSIIVSVFDNNLDPGNHMGIIRSTFSSIIGFLLEDSTKDKLKCDGKTMFFRNLTVGIISIVIVVVIIIAYAYGYDNNNSSLILLKNALSSCVGFLISACKDCGE